MRSKRTSRVPARLNSSVRLHGEPLERRCLLAGAPFVESTTPGLNGNPSIVAGITSIKVVFNETVTGGAVSSNYDLRAAGADTLFDTSDDVLYPTTPTYSGRTATVKFDRIPVGAYRFTAYDTIVDLQGEMLDGDGNGTAGGAYVRTFSIIPGAASKFALAGIPSVVDAGQQYGLSVTAMDAYNNVATSYTGTVQFTSKDAAAILPPNFTFAAANAGVATLPVTLMTGDTGVWVKSTDTVAGFSKSLTGITVIAHGLSGFEVTGLAPSIEAGTTQFVTLSALDIAGGVFDDYLGTISVTTSDPLGVVPGNITLTSADAGSRQISVTLKTAGPQTLTITDIASGTFTTVSAGTVVHADLAGFSVAGFPSPTIAGDAHPFGVSALDAYGNVVLDYIGTVAFSSGDTNAILPTSYTFTLADAGTADFTAVLRNTAQNRAIVVTDTATGATGKQSGIVVLAAFISYSATSNIIYIDGATATLTDIKYLVPSAPLALVDAGAAIWKLDANIRIINGGTLNLHGISIGGDVNQLRLKSQNSSAANSIVEIRGDYGNIDIRSTYITSWNTSGPDTEYGTYKRSYIRVRSSLAADGVTPLESRMDVIDSHIAYLGADVSEAYGLSWKVIGDPGPNNELYDLVNVYGDIRNSYIHHNYFGMFSYGHQGGVWSNNEVSHNVIYGFDPHDDSDFITIADNYVHDNGKHGIICSKRCDNITITGNTSNDNGGNGIMLHREIDYSVVTGNTTEGNADSGIAVFDSRHNLIADNTARFNLHGLRLTMGAANNLVQNNLLTDNLDQGLKFFQGNDPPRPGDDGRPKNNTLIGNVIANNGGYGVRVRDADSNIFENNQIYGNAEDNTVLFEFSSSNAFRSHELPSGTFINVRGGSSLPSSLLVSDQDFTAIDIDQFSTVTFTDDEGAIFALFDEDGDAAPGDVNLVNSTGSKLVVTSALTGVTDDAFIERLPLRVAPVGGTATIEPVNGATSFKVTASSASVALDLVFDQLAAAQTYELSRNGTTVGSGAANGAGSLSLSTTPGTTANVLYELEAAAAPLRAARGTSSNPFAVARDGLFADLESSGAKVTDGLPSPRGRRRLIDVALL